MGFGWATNLRAQLGDHASVGTKNISVVNADSFWEDGYFEETSVQAMRDVDPATPADPSNHNRDKPGDWAWAWQGPMWASLLAGAVAATLVRHRLGATVLWPLPAYALVFGVAALTAGCDGHSADPRKIAMREGAAGQR